MITSPLKDFLTKVAQFYRDDTCRVNISLVLKYLGIKPVLGEDAQEAQVFNPSIGGMPSAQEVQKLVIGTITSGKKKKLPLQGVDH